MPITDNKLINKYITPESKLKARLAGRLPANQTDEDDRFQIPHNLEAEQVLLGAVLMNNQVLEKLEHFLLAEHFYDPVHIRIYDAIYKLWQKGIIASPITLKSRFEQDEALQNHGGSNYLGTLASMASTIINVRDYGKLIQELAIRRMLLDTGQEIMYNAYDYQEGTVEEQIENAEKSIYSLAEKGSRKTVQAMKSIVVSSVDDVTSAMKSKSSTIGVSTGFQGLDFALGGLQRQKLYILAARPGQGKTALALNIAHHAARHYLKKHKKTGKELQNVLFFSLEMGSNELAKRLIISESGIDSAKVNNGRLSDEDFQKYVRASNIISELPIHVDERAGLSSSQLVSTVRREKRQHHIGLVIVDYLGLMRPSNTSPYANRNDQITEISNTLKGVSKEFDVPVLALSQLSRNCENRTDKRPILADLRDSGSIEQDADAVMFLYRENYYLAQRTAGIDQTGPAELIIAKQRSGPTGMVDMYYHAAQTRFGEVDSR